VYEEEQEKVEYEVVAVGFGMIFGPSKVVGHLVMVNQRIC
jgi:hypothetical protein